MWGPRGGKGMQHGASGNDSTAVPFAEQCHSLTRPAKAPSLAMFILYFTAKPGLTKFRACQCWSCIKKIWWSKDHMLELMKRQFVQRMSPLIQGRHLLDKLKTKSNGFSHRNSTYNGHINLKKKKAVACIKLWSMMRDYSLWMHIRLISSDCTLIHLVAVRTLA